MKFYDMINQTIKNTKKKKMKLNNASNKVFKDNYITFFLAINIKIEIKNIL